MQTTELYNVRIHGQGEPQAIRIHEGKITTIGERQGDRRAIDGQGLVAIPGLIDGHVHFRHFGEAEKDDWPHACRAAIAGGVTTVLEMGNHPPPYAITTAEAFAQKVTALRALHVPIHWRLWFMATADGIEEFKWIRNHHVFSQYLAGIKLCMEETTGGIIVSKRRDQREWCAVAAETTTLIAAHVGNQAMIDKNRRRYPAPRIVDHCRIRDTAVELSGGRRFLELLEITGAQGEIKHVSTPELILATQQARRKGVEVSLEMCPHHWLLDERSMLREGAGFFKMNPPLRTPEQVRCMPKHLVDGTVNTIATDHAAHTRAAKRHTELDQVPSGIPGVQEMLPLGMRLVQEGVLTLDRLISLCARNPAQVYGLDSRGALAVGMEADIVLLDPNEQSAITAREVESKCGWTAYRGRKVYGKPKLVMVGGNVVLNHLLST